MSELDLNDVLPYSLTCPGCDTYEEGEHHTSVPAPTYCTDCTQAAVDLAGQKFDTLGHAEDVIAQTIETIGWWEDARRWFDVEGIAGEVVEIHPGDPVTGYYWQIITEPAEFWQIVAAHRLDEFEAANRSEVQA